MKEINKYIIVGMSRGGRISCVTNTTNEEIFWPSLSQKLIDKFNFAYDFYANRLNTEKYFAVIECDGEYEDGVPINPIINNIELK